MKRWLALALVAGYMTLAPYCVIGASLLSTTHGMPEISAHEAHAMSDCGMPQGHCAGATARGGIDHHSNMYLSMTSLFPASHFDLLTSLALFVVLCAIAFGIATILLPFFATICVYRHAPPDITRATAYHRFIAWISHLEMSPTYAA